MNNRVIITKELSVSKCAALNFLKKARLPERRTRQEEVHRGLQGVLPARQGRKVLGRGLQALRHGRLRQDRLPGVPRRRLNHEQQRHPQEAPARLRPL